MRVLVLNAGSSSLKASVVESLTEALLAGVETDWPAADDDSVGADAILAGALSGLASGVDAVGHRIVHGGSRYVSPTPVDDDLIAEVERLDSLAPLHNRRSALVMRAARSRLSDVPHVACFDTAFHAGLPEEARRYALPRDWVDEHEIRRYGFHGLSVAWSVHRAADLLDRPAADLRLVVAHLGSGCSVTAVDGGSSVETSMGYTPLEGLMMGTRSGSIDPGIILRLAASGISAADLADGLEHRAGLLAIGGTASARELEDRAVAGDAPATLALAMFERRAAGAIAAAATALPSLDGVVFTGGIGAHSARIRSGIVTRLGVIGLRSLTADADGDAVLDRGPPAVMALTAREDVVIAGEVTNLLA